MPTIHHYHQQTGEYLSQAAAALDPIEQQPLVPAYATLLAPPKTKKGRVAVFDEAKQSWSSVADHRGEVYDTSSLQAQTFNQLGALPATLTPIAPKAYEAWDAVSKAWLIDVEQVRQVQMQQLQVSYRQALGAGISFQGAVFDSEPDSLNEVLTAIANGWALPADFAWIDASNTPHPADLVFLQGLSAALAEHKASLFSKLQGLKTTLRSATTPADMEVVAW